MHQEANRQTVLLNLINEKEIKNSEIPIFDRFVGKISDTVIKYFNKNYKLVKIKLTLRQQKIHMELLEKEEVL